MCLAITKNQTSFVRERAHRLNANPNCKASQIGFRVTINKG